MEHEITENPLRGVEAKVGSGHYGVFDHGAHVWSWQPDGAAPVIWMSAKSWFSDGQPIRGGVPICFPWFGPGRTGDMEPAHGFARITEWTLAEQGEDEHRDDDRRRRTVRAERASHSVQEKAKQDEPRREEERRRDEEKE